MTARPSGEVIKLLCVFNAVAGAGSDKFLIEFVRGADRLRLEPEIALLYPAGFDHELAPSRVHYLSRGAWQASGLRRAWHRVLGILALARLMPKFDAVLSFGSLFNGCVTLSARLARFQGPVLLIESVHQSSANPRGRLLRAVRRLYVNWTYNLATAVVACAEGTASDLRDYFGVSRRLHVIQYGLDLAEIKRKSTGPVTHEWLGEGRQFKTLIAVGRLAEQKGLEYLFKAMTMLPDTVRLILVGDGPLRKQLESLAESLMIADRVSFVGYDRNPYGYIAHSDIFVLPSLYEGLPLVLIEALALGLPIVAADCPSGPAEMLAGGSYGRLVPVRDPIALASAIRELLENPLELQRLRSAAPQRAESFSLERSLAEYERLIRTLTRPNVANEAAVLSRTP